MTAKEERQKAWGFLQQADTYKKYADKFSDFVCAVKNERVSLRRHEVERRNIFVDTQQIFGGSVENAINCLAQLPKNGTFEKFPTWYGFELHVVTYSMETDEEYGERLFESFEDYLSQKNELIERQKKLNEIKELEKKLQFLKSNL